LLAKTTKLKQVEENQAIHWRRLSRIKWLGEGEEVSKYYFKLLKAKQKRESLLLLILDDGIEITDTTKILKETTQFYARLYSAGHPSSETEQARRTLFKLPCTKVTPGEKVMLEAVPTPLEVKETLLLIPLDKSPGIDGLTAEVHRACWTFMAEDFLAMTIKFWQTGELVTKVKEGLIKLIPKKADKRRLKDWRPLTMLTTAYKIIAKLLALRLRLVIPSLVSTQQTGFVPGRNILENISMAWLTADWLKHTQKQALFLSLDF
jgi:hypothetical protein